MFGIVSFPHRHFPRKAKEFLKVSKLPTKQPPKVFIRTTSRNHLNPLLALLFKTKGIKVVKFGSIIFARQLRIINSKLPIRVQNQISKHKKSFLIFMFSFFPIVHYTYAHRETNKITGRKRWISFTEEQIGILANDDSEAIVKTYGEKFLSDKSEIYQQCQSIVSNIVSANNDMDQVKNKSWKLFVIDDITTMNAFVLPNGEIYVFTGKPIPIICISIYSTV